MTGEPHSQTRPEKLLRLLVGLGYGTRREVEQLLRAGRVTDAGGAVRARGEERIPHAAVRVDGQPLDPPPGVVLALHKPTGVVCSTAEADGLPVYTLLPPRFRRRQPLLSTVGRLDQDTSGLLLLTDDGQYLHRIISPRHHVQKVYLASLARPLQGHEAEVFASGALQLRGEARPCAPAALWPLAEDPRQARVVLTEGRYHQVRRMFAAVGNHVLALKRLSIGGLSLGALPEGAWRVLTATERLAVFSLAPPQCPTGNAETSVFLG